MKIQLSVTNTILGKVQELFHKNELNNIHINHDLKGYKYIKNLSINTSGDHIVVALYQKNKSLFIWKLYSSKYKTLRYWQLRNEYSLLKLLSKKQIHVGAYDIMFPKISDEICNDQIFGFCLPYYKGKPLEMTSENKKFEILNLVLKSLKSYFEYAQNTKIRNIPSRNQLHLIIGFVYYSLKVLIKDIDHIGIYYHLFKRFIFYYLKNILAKEYHQSLTHRDLHGNNIILQDRSIIILDPALLVKWNLEAEIAIIVSIYYRNLDNHKLISFVKNQLIYSNSLILFKLILIFHIFESLAVDKKSTKDYIKMRDLAKSNFIQQLFAL